MDNSQNAEFYLVVPPGLEAVALRELTFWLESFADHPFSCRAAPGGIEAELPMEIGLALNSALKVPSRVLLRIKSFRCRDFTKLFKTIKKIRWNDRLGGGHVTWSVSSKKSRLKMKKRIEQTCAEAFAEYRRTQPPKKTAATEELTVFVRLNEDLCELSLDTTGEHLHRRGYKPYASEAPMRENLAAALIWKMIGEDDLSLLERTTLTDPMCGSGTLVIEGLRLFTVNRREFAFHKTPLAKQAAVPANGEWRWGGGMAADLLDKNVSIAEKNAEQAGVADRIVFRQGDFFKSPWPGKNGLSWIVMNPPYGLRLKTGKDDDGYFYKILQRAFELQADKIGCLMPVQPSRKLDQKYGHYVRREGLDFKNGGIPVRFVIYERLK